MKLVIPVIRKSDEPKYGTGKHYEDIVYTRNGKQVISRREDGRKKDDKKQGKNKKAKTKKTSGKILNYELGDSVNFKSTNGVIEGAEIIAQGPTGVQVKKDGVVYKVNHADVLKKTKNANGTIPADSFDANSYKSQFTDPKCTNDKDGINHVYDLLGSDGRDTRAMVEQKLNEQTHRMKKGDTQIRNMINIVYDEKGKFVSGEYTPERKKLHQKIINDILSPEKISACLPEKGEKPKFIMFGGRGGSGKSWFTDKDRAAKDGREVMFDSDKYLILDADEIKKSLPEFKGWNAGEVHEESSDLMKQIKATAMSLGINIIIDGTMNYNSKKPDKVKNEMLDAKSKGYSLEAHYMFTPLQKSCINAMNRFKTSKGDYSGRLVPTDILLSMQDNEKSFDSIKDIVDDWTFRDNQNFEAKLISQKGLK